MKQKIKCAVPSCKKMINRNSDLMRDGLIYCWKHFHEFDRLWGIKKPCCQKTAKAIFDDLDNITIRGRMREFWYLADNPEIKELKKKYLNDVVAKQSTSEQYGCEK